MAGARTPSEEVPSKCSVDQAMRLASLGFGVLATFVLCVSVAADYWLHTNEPVDFGAQLQFAGVSTPLPAEGEPEAGEQPRGSTVTVLSTNSGLWRVCVSTKPDPTLVVDDEDVEPVELPSCSAIAYFGQSSERVDGAETTFSMLRGIRKATPVIMISLMLIVAAVPLSFMGYLRHDFRTLVGAVLSIIASLNLALGQIFYISAVNDEMAQWKKPENAREDQIFTYAYGWAFYAAGSSFVFAMVSAVGHISLYLNRYSGDVKDMLVIVPGLDFKGVITADPVSSGQETESDCGHHNQSIIF